MKSFHKTQLSQALKISRRGRRGAKIQCLSKLRVTTGASTQRLRAASRRPESAEKKRSSCAKGLRLNL